jgi:hypothetical protein
LGSPNRRSTLGDSHFFRVLFLRAAPNRYSVEWSGRPDLRGGRDSRPFSGHAGCWAFAVSTELGAANRFAGSISCKKRSL